MRCAQCGHENALSASTCARCQAVLASPTVPTSSDEIRRSSPPMVRRPPPIRHRPPRDTEIGAAPDTLLDIGGERRDPTSPWGTGAPLSLSELSEIDRSLAGDSATEQIPMADLLAKAAEPNRPREPWEEVIAAAPPSLLKKWGTTPEAEAETRVGNKASDRATSVATQFDLPPQKPRASEPAVSQRPMPVSVPPRVSPLARSADPKTSAPRPAEPSRAPSPPRTPEIPKVLSEDTDLAFPQLNRAGFPVERPPIAKPSEWGTTGTTGPTGVAGGEARPFRLPSVSTSLDERAPNIPRGMSQETSPENRLGLEKSPSAPPKSLPPRSLKPLRSETAPTDVPLTARGESSTIGLPRPPPLESPLLPVLGGSTAADTPRPLRSLSSLAQEPTRPPFQIPSSGTPNPGAIPIPPAETKAPLNPPPPPRQPPERFQTLPTLGEVPRPSSIGADSARMPRVEQPKAPEPLRSSPPAPLRSSPPTAGLSRAPAPLPGKTVADPGRISAPSLKSSSPELPRVSQPQRPVESLRASVTPPVRAPDKTAAPVRAIPAAETTRPPAPLPRPPVRSDSITDDPSRPGFAVTGHGPITHSRTQPEAIRQAQETGTPPGSWDSLVPPPAKRDAKPLAALIDDSLLPWEASGPLDTALKNPPVMLPKQLTADLEMPPLEPSKSSLPSARSIGFPESTPNSGTMVGRLGPTEHESGEHGGEMTRVALEGELAGPAPLPPPTLPERDPSAQNLAPFQPPPERQPPERNYPSEIRPSPIPASRSLPPQAPPPASTTPRANPPALVAPPRPTPLVPPSSLPPRAKTPLPRGLSETEPAEPQSMPGMPVHQLTGEARDPASMPGFSPAPVFDAASDPAWMIQAKKVEEPPPPLEETRAMPRSELEGLEDLNDKTSDPLPSVSSLEEGVVERTAELPMSAPRTFVLAKTFSRWIAAAFDLAIVLGLLQGAALLGVLGDDLKVILPPHLPDLLLNASVAKLAPLGATLIGLALALSTLSTGLLGASPGKLLLGQRVIVRKTGDRPGFFRAAFRAMFSVLSALLGGAGYFWPILDRQYRALHDVLSGTAVVKRRGGGATSG